MPLTHLIFFEEPMEITDEQYAEALALGHVRKDGADTPAGEPPAAGPMTGGGTGTVTSGDDGVPADDDHTDEQGA